jgi:N6-adenosine-specific RNA methylase IME4
VQKKPLVPRLTKRTSPSLTEKSCVSLPPLHIDWMRHREVSVRDSASSNVLVIAPHGFPGNDDNTEILAYHLAQKLESHAVINNRKYKRPGKKWANDEPGFVADLNNPSDVEKFAPDFLEKLMGKVDHLCKNYQKAMLVFIHGMDDDETDKEFPNMMCDVGVGYSGSKHDPAKAFATKDFVEDLLDKLQKNKVWPAHVGARFTGSGTMAAYFHNHPGYEKVESVQLELRCENVRETSADLEATAEKLRKTIEGVTGFHKKESSMPDIVIDAEFESLLPPLSEAEFAQLEKNILASGGCREPVSVWRHDGKRILLDGHHRLKICRKHGLPDPAVQEIELGSRAEAILWITDNQRGRRNVTAFQRIEMAYRREPAIRERAKAKQKDAHKVRGKGAETKGDAPLHTDEILGEYAGVSAKTYSKARYIFEHGSEELIKKWRDGDIKVDAAYRKIEKPPKQVATKKAVKTTGPGVQAESLPESPPGAKPAPQPDAPLSLPDLPSPCDVIIVNVPWELASVTVEKLAALPIPKLSQDDCMLWLRSTNSRAPEAYTLINSWGFQPKTLFTWIKLEPKPAKWLNDRSEHYVLAVKGNPPVDEERKFSTASETGAAKDNPKRPMQFYRQIELYCSGKTRLDVFSETTRDGWIPWNPWAVDEQVKLSMGEKVAPETKEKGSKKESAKSTKKERKRKPTSKKKRPNESD